MSSSADIDGEGAKSVAESLRAANVGAEAVTVDVTDRSAVDDMVATGIDTFGRIDFLFNSHRVGGAPVVLLDIDADLWRQTYALNVDGVFHTMQSVLPHMLENGHGVIVNIASMAHRRGGPGHSTHYASAKGAVVTLTMGVAREFVEQGIRALSFRRAHRHRVQVDLLAGTETAHDRRRADETHGHAGGDRRDGAVHVFRRLRIHDRPALSISMAAAGSARRDDND